MRKKIGKKNRAVLKLKLNKLGKGLLRQNGQIDVLVRTTVQDRLGQVTVLQRLVKLLRR